MKLLRKKPNNDLNSLRIRLRATVDFLEQLKSDGTYATLSAKNQHHLDMLCESYDSMYRHES